MASVKNIFFNFLFIVFFCNWFEAVVPYLCKENNRVGKCELLENCESLKNTRLAAEVHFNADCSRSGLTGTVVCCQTQRRRYVPKTTPRTTTRRTTTRRRTTTVSPQRVGLNPRGLELLNNNNCGAIKNDRIAHAVNAVQGEFPWVAMLLYAEMKPLCGGSIITDRYILTAAHCIKPELQRVRLGEHRISTIRDCVSGVCQSFEEFGIDPYQKPQVHPNYRSLANYKDIALIKLDRTIDFAAHRHIKPVCLPIPPMISPVLPSDDLILAGWGLKENDLPVDILQKGVMKLEELNRCETLYSLYKVDDSRLCIQAGANNSVSCRGDSGAPLFWKSEYISNNYILQRYTQIGLVSLGYGKECGSLTSEPFMYENVTDSLQWITNAILN